MDASLLFECLDVPPLSLSLAVIDTIAVDQELQQGIKNPLPQDPESGPYLDQIANPSLPLDGSTRAYLEPFSLHDTTKLLLRNGLVYSPQDIDIKLSLLRNHHDSLTAGDLWEPRRWNSSPVTIIGHGCVRLSMNTSDHAAPVQETSPLAQNFTVSCAFCRFHSHHGFQFLWISSLSLPPLKVMMLSM